MKTTKLMVLGVLLGTCTFAAAQEKPKREVRQGREMPAMLLEKFDKDGDGKLSDDERKAMQEERRVMAAKRHAEMLAKFDKDGDGKLSDDERSAMRDAMEARRKEILEKYDADKNGKLSPDEVKAARDAGEEMPDWAGRGPGGKGGPDGKGPGGPGGKGKGGPGGKGKPPVAPAE